MITKNQIILIKGNKDNWYDRAIFVVKDNYANGQIPQNFIIEKDGIINTKIPNNANFSNNIFEMPTQIESNKNTLSNINFDVFLNIISIIGFILISLLLIYNYYN